MQRTAILFWTMLVTIGVVASGANLGQNAYLDQICPAALESNLDFNLVQYVSIILLLFTVSAPHAFKEKLRASSYTNVDMGGVTDTSPLVY